MKPARQIVHALQFTLCGPDQHARSCDAVTKAIEAERATLEAERSAWRERIETMRTALWKIGHGQSPIVGEPGRDYWQVACENICQFAIDALATDTEASK